MYNLLTKRLIRVKVQLLQPTLSAWCEIWIERLALAAECRMLKTKRCWRWWKRALMVTRKIVAVHLIRCVIAAQRWWMMVVMVLPYWWRHRQRATRVLSKPSSSVRKPNLNSRFGQVGRLSKFFARVHIRILRASKSLFESLKLIARKSGSRSSLLSLKQNARLGFRVWVGWTATCLKIN